MKRMVVMLAALLLVACSGKSPVAPLPPTVTGNWQGDIAGPQVLTLALSQSGGTVSGSGILTNTPSGTRALTATGTFIDPVLSMTISSGTTQPFNLTATLTNGTLYGNLQGSGFTGSMIAMYRQ
jgi:hypothetical protein